MNNRRDFIKTSAAGIAGMAGLSSIERLEASIASATSATPETPRFIFLRKSNGTFPTELVPTSLSEADKKKETAKKAFEVDLDKHELPDWMQPLAEHKDNLCILQGLSAKMCTMGHSTYQSPLAVSRSAERVATITRASVDVELARMFPAPFEHIELTCAANRKGVVRGMSSIGPKQPNYAFASPSAAYNNLFLTALEKTNSQKADDDLYAFLSRNIGKEDIRTRDLREASKIGNYIDSIDSLISRNEQLQSMSQQIKASLPKIEQAIMRDQYDTVEQQFAFVEILVSSLQAGLANVVTYTLDNLETRYEGVVEPAIALHDIGHNKALKGIPALEIREKLRTHHMNVVGSIAKKLKQLPEGKGNMFDNTLIMYLPENGETHHSQGTEVPFVILAGKNVKLNLARRYIRLPNYNQPGHKTLGNWYTTILNAYGNNIKHYGDKDVGLTIPQEGPIPQLMV
jgi:hypothetical protein